MASTVTFAERNAGLQANTINGPVSTTFHLAPERQETPPQPSIVIPFSRDADFIERSSTLDELQRRCAAPGSRTALVGLGGVGKSQLAIEHAYRTYELSPETWVFWVHASNPDRFEQSFRDIADHVKIAGRNDPQANIFKLVHGWLCSSKHRWLLVLDNVDDARFLLDVRISKAANASGDAKPLRDYLPHCQRGSMLVTTRNKDAALQLVEQRDILPVEPMDQAQGIELFNKKLGAQEASENVAELADELEYMPLAIVQAAAYISRRAPRYSVARYLDKFRRSDREKTTLLDCEAGQLRRDREAKNSIIITWHISFKYLSDTNKSAADLLSLMSFFDRQGIPESLIHMGNFEDDVLALRELYFISVVGDGTTFEMHSLIQLATRTWLTANGKLEWWKQRFISNLCAAYPDGEYENWPTCQALFAHVKSAVEQPPENESSLLEWATLLYHAAWYSDQAGNIIDAIILAEKSLSARKKVLGHEHQDTLSSMEMVGKSYHLGGRWNEAEELFIHVMKTRKEKLGVDHLDTANSMNHLAVTYLDQGQWSKAEELFMQGLEILKKKLEADHPSTLISMSNLASTYQKQERWDRAEQLEVQVLEACKKKLGEDHPDTLSSMGNLASTYSNQGRWDRAEQLEVQVLEARKKKLGPDHPDTLISMGNLASTYSNQGRWDRAEQLEVQALEACKKKLGADHPNTLSIMNNLASIYSNQGRWDRAEQLEVQVLEAYKKKLGVDHHDTLLGMNNLAWTWGKQGRTADAILLLRECVQLSQHVLKPDHPNFISFSSNLGILEAGQADAGVAA